MPAAEWSGASPDADRGPRPIGVVLLSLAVWMVAASWLASAAFFAREGADFYTGRGHVRDLFAALFFFASLMVLVPALLLGVLGWGLWRGSFGARIVAVALAGLVALVGAGGVLKMAGAGGLTSPPFWWAFATMAAGGGMVAYLMWAPVRAWFR